MSSFNGELLHFNAVRLRVTGSGNLQLTLQSLDTINQLGLTPLPLSVTTNREPTVLSNFVEQRSSLRIGTSQINEYFIVSKMVVFVKPIGNQFPQ